MATRTSGTTPNQIRRETTSIFIGIGMKLWNLNDSASAVLLVATLTMIMGCQKSSYFVGDLTQDRMVGTWVMVAKSTNVPPPAVPHHDCQLAINLNGSFEARNFPLVIGFSPKSEVKYVSERGTWNLADNGAGGTRSRWKLNLTFGASRFETAWDVAGSSKSLRLFGRTDLDSWIGFEFAPAADAEK